MNCGSCNLPWIAWWKLQNSGQRREKENWGSACVIKGRAHTLQNSMGIEAGLPNTPVGGTSVRFPCAQWGVAAANHAAERGEPMKSSYTIQDQSACVVEKRRKSQVSVSALASSRQRGFPRTVLTFAVSLGVCSTQAQDGSIPEENPSLQPTPAPSVQPELPRPWISKDWRSQPSTPVQDGLASSTNWTFKPAPSAGLVLSAVDEASSAQSGKEPLKLKLQAVPESIWETGVGEGFRPHTQSIELSAGATYGLDIFGSRERHHLAMASLTYGYMLRARGEGHWYHGNPELRLELFGGAQFDPDTRRFIGLAPHLRYNFATGTRWVPFLGAGAGVTATTIGPPDLSGTFEFNLQAGTGIQYFIMDHLAIGLEARYVHWSCAGTHKPNQGLNGITSLLGITCFF